MKVKGLDGKVHKWNLHGCKKDGNEERPRSSFHLRARALLQQLFPFDQRLEEVPIPGSKMHADFFLPGRNLLIEVQGQQHEEFIEFFHRTVLGFLQGQERDTAKLGFCEINNINYAELYHDESDATWTKRIITALGLERDDC